MRVVAEKPHGAVVTFDITAIAWHLVFEGCCRLYFVSYNNLSFFDVVHMKWACNKNGGVALWTAGQRNYWDRREFLWKVMVRPPNPSPTFMNFPLTWTNWRQGEPNNYGGYEGCIFMWLDHQYQWNDEPCDRHYCFVCEHPM